VFEVIAMWSYRDVAPTALVLGWFVLCYRDVTPTALGLGWIVLCYRDDAATALELYWVCVMLSRCRTYGAWIVLGCVVLSRCRTYGAWIVLGLCGSIEMSHLRRSDCIGFVWFYRDVAPDGAWIGFLGRVKSLANKTARALERLI
jgi:hypothetical protein